MNYKTGCLVLQLCLARLSTGKPGNYQFQQYCPIS